MVVMRALPKYLRRRAIVFVEHGGVTVYHVWRWCGRILRTECFATTPEGAWCERDRAPAEWWNSVFYIDRIPASIRRELPLKVDVACARTLVESWRAAMAAKRAIIIRAIDEGFPLLEAQALPQPACYALTRAYPSPDAADIPF